MRAGRQCETSGARRRRTAMDVLAIIIILGMCGSLSSGNVKTAPPEDLDGSGDDEDFSGSGFGSILVDSKDGDVFSTTVPPLVPTVTHGSTTQKLGIDVKGETEEDNVTQHTETTKPHEDIFAFGPVGNGPLAEVTTLEPTTQQTSTVESLNDVKHHHHHHHHHHHTTIPVTSLPAKLDVEETTTGHDEVKKPFVAPEETTTSTPDGDDLVQNVTLIPEDSVQHIDHPETTSGLTSTPYVEIEETTTDLVDIDRIPGFVESVEKTTVTDEASTHKPHKHHPHHTTTSTAIPLNGSDILLEATEKPDYLEPEKDLDQQGKTTTMPSSHDEHHDHKHPHHKHHHHTTPGVTQSTVSEQFIVHAQDPKGRRVDMPPAESTTAVPVLSEDEEPLGSTVQYNKSVIAIQDEDGVDSAEEGSGNPTENDIFFEQATVPVNKGDKVAPVPGDGSSGASHGIMERKELLAGIIAGGLAGLVFAASLVAFVLYRMKKKDEGSYSLEEPKQSNGGYQKPREQREFYA